MKLKLKILVLAYLLLICGPESTILNQTDDLIVLTKVGFPYKIHQDLVVDENQTLIIEPGVTLHFAPTKQFMVIGNLIAEGKNDERITLAPLENHSTTNHLTNYSISRNLRFLNESGYPSGKLELFDSNKWHKVCFRRNEDKINQDYFVKSICSNFHYRKGWIKKSFNSAGFRIALISSCSENHIQSFDFRDYCYLRTDLNGSFTWYYQECFQIECMNESSFVHHWGGLVIDGISISEKTSLSLVDINRAGEWSNGLVANRGSVVFIKLKLKEFESCRNEVRRLVFIGVGT
ncbi:bark beetle [Brachionus plicatilis]|uniref:Bark beetle n=1 Tax=Brachionus plicatilis TaxID=10195 RepID=A0A3M7QS55_BRAPC|nr:bark beetle [Brachionus plicatilis]